jgi:mono/diheme cytochrome c family protein
MKRLAGSVGVGMWVLLLTGCGDRQAGGDAVPARPTFTKHVAPIIYEHCAYCHHPGQAAPFDLLTFADVSQRSRQIAEVVTSRYMPPWLPEPGFNHFQNERVLTEQEIALVNAWVAAGAPEGNPADLPPLPKFASEWFLGQPDLVVRLPEPYELPADGPDVYRNFVIPIPTDREHHVRALEFRPGNARVVHHAFLAVDPTGESRRDDLRDEAPGYPGMHLPRTGEVPQGQFFSWQPGKVPMGGDPARAWRLPAGAWLVIQVHMQTTGRPERVQPEVGFYFAEQPGTDITFKLGLSSYALDIPPGATNFVAEDGFELPVDVELLAILPHAHYLAKTMHGLATLPDGSNRWLLNIGQWDFNWQGEYWYREPVQLPKGTRVGMRFFYDNSTNNPVNPFNPPQPVSYGLNSTDEMAELWMIFRLRSAEDQVRLSRAVLPKLAAEVVTYNLKLLEKDPENARSWLQVGTARYALGQFEASAEALRRALLHDSGLDEAHYYLGLIAYDVRDYPRALNSFQTAVGLNPGHYKAHGYLGLTFLSLGDFDRSEASLREALRIQPDDPVTLKNLELLHRVRSGQTTVPAVTP